MKVYTDITSSEEIVSDSFKFNYIFENVGVEIKSSFIQKNEGDIDIGCGNAFGQNDEEAKGDGGEKILDIIDAFKYNETAFDKKGYTTYIKNFMKKVKTHLEQTKPERVADFVKGAGEMVKWILGNFDEFSFYTPESYDTENTIILSYYKGEDATPTFVYFIDGLKGETV
ncbi:translationally controlled tumor protein, putative [Ichthyophthirius multifiliis]|uniref:Translationally controlled tumor protein, putative n=1 Tax=Ichthyophthirius multifiliis TaxID=5932 RepID=G0QVK5_ICHMU|nr:translationally controlled tumor protein, putative [Ichthyophthirius multifiliis]EGR30765.1 translationally controlled tumor protein, putative [Ichthyophthirius multifiliis]|eukprot:XP_004032352.1 translationally controlled tumor protein, putative [Ichthyophthirius multifiliis]